MRITASQLRRIIKEEVSRALNESAAGDSEEEIRAYIEANKTRNGWAADVGKNMIGDLLQKQMEELAAGQIPNEYTAELEHAMKVAEIGQKMDKEANAALKASRAAARGSRKYY